MLVVSDTSPITALLQTGLENLLPELFQRVVIPAAVRDELLLAHPQLPGWLEVCTPEIIPDAVREACLDRGETEAIALALELNPDALLLDEQNGRRTARALGIPLTGLLGILLLAKRLGRIAAVAPIIIGLQTQAGCWFADSLVRDVLRAAGEGK
jgi:uncharacterized protein